MDRPPTYDEVLQSSKVRTPILIPVILFSSCMRSFSSSSASYTCNVCEYTAALLHTLVQWWAQRGYQWGTYSNDVGEHPTGLKDLGSQDYSRSIFLVRVHWAEW